MPEYISKGAGWKQVAVFNPAAPVKKVAQEVKEVVKQSATTKPVKKTRRKRNA